jgi:hypothetical protein
MDIYCHVRERDSRQGFILDIEFIDNLQVVTTNNYRTVAISTIYIITRAHAKPFPAGSGNGSKKWLYLCFPAQVLSEWRLIYICVC